MKIETKFDLLQKVQILQLETAGVVKAIYITPSGGTQYSVRYFGRDRSPQSEYFLEDELSAELAPEKKAGFRS